MSIATHIIPDKFKDPATGELKVDSLSTPYSELGKRDCQKPHLFRKRPMSIASNAIMGFSMLIRI